MISAIRQLAELQQLVEKAVPFLEAGDGRNALRVLTSVAEAFVDGWLEESYSGDERMYLMSDDIARMMAEAVLFSDLGPTSVTRWRSRLKTGTNVSRTTVWTTVLP